MSTLSGAWRRALPSRLEVDTAALLGANALNLVLGMAYWAVGARLLPTPVVGRAMTMVTAATSIAAFANLGLGPVVERFLPASGRLATRLVARVHGVALLTSTIAAIAFVTIDPVTDLFADRFEHWLFVALVATLSAFGLQDNDLVALGGARWGAACNVTFAVAKLVGISLLATFGTAGALVGSWMLPAATLAVVVFVAIGRHLLPLQRRMLDEHPTLPPRREVATFWGASIAWMIGGAVPAFVVPLAVAETQGMRAAAHFNATWMIVSASTTVMSLASGPFVAAASRPDADIAARAREFVRFITVVGVLRSVGVAGAGYVALHVYGPGYVREGAPLLLLMAGVHLLSVPAYVYGAFARVYRTVWYPTLVNALGSTVVVLLTPFLVHRAGLPGVGLAYLAQETLTFCLALGPLRRLLGRARLGDVPRVTADAAQPA